MTAGYAAESDGSATVSYRAAVDSEAAAPRDDGDDPAQYPEPPAGRQHERWALHADFARDRERAIADGEFR
jgi:hypothetical protein